MTDRSMGILQQADEERARRKDNPDDWPQRKARLEEDADNLDGCPVSFDRRSATSLAGDIRAALQRESEMRDERDRYAKAWKESCDRNVVLRQRVEELERISRSAEADAAWDSALYNQRRAEAAEAKLARVIAALENAKGRSPGLVPDLLAALAAAKEKEDRG